MTQDRSDTEPLVRVHLQVGGSSGVTGRDWRLQSECLFIVFYFKVIYSEAFKAVSERFPSAWSGVR